MARNPLISEAHSGERDLYLVRVTRMKSASPMMLLPGTETALTIVSGKDSLQNYLSEEYSAGPCRAWIVSIGNIPEASFAEVKMVPQLKIPT